MCLARASSMARRTPRAPRSTRSICNCSVSANQPALEPPTAVVRPVARLTTRARVVSAPGTAEYREELYKCHGPFFDIHGACDGALSGLHKCVNQPGEGWGRGRGGEGVGVGAGLPASLQQTVSTPPPTAHPTPTRRTLPPNCLLRTALRPLPPKDRDCLTTPLPG